MPATQRGSVRTLPSGKKQLRYYDNDGQRQSGGVFVTRSEAWKHFRDVIEPQLRYEPVTLPDLTLAEFADVYLERHAAVVRGRTVKILRDRLGYAIRVYGNVTLGELERMSGELAAAGVTVFELAKIMGSSVRMIERHYGALLDGAGAGISGRLDALEAELERADDIRDGGVTR